MIHQRPPTCLKILENGLTRRLRPKIMPILLRNPEKEPYDPKIATFTPFLRRFFGLWGLYGPFFVELLKKRSDPTKRFTVQRTSCQNYATLAMICGVALSPWLCRCAVRWNSTFGSRENKKGERPPTTLRDIEARSSPWPRLPRNNKRVATRS